MTKYTDLPQPISVGTRVGKLVVLEMFHKDGYVRCRCRCDCGNVSIHRKHQLARGVAKSCGCMCGQHLYKHGEGGKPTHEYYVWKGMRDRCTHPSHRCWRRYGGRGIKVCDRWNSYATFLSDMGRCPPGDTLERIDNDGNYEPGNCRWATYKEQARHRSNTRYATVFGKMRLLIEWAEEWSRASGLHPRSLYMRIHRGSSPEEALRELAPLYTARGT